MNRFRVTKSKATIDVVFDDGGMNLLSRTALRELRAHLAAVSGEAAVLTFRSGRPSLFAAGADMAEMERFGAREAEDFATLGQEVFATLEALPLMTVAMIDGDCFGGALDLALAFDIRVATTRSRFSHPGARLGIVTGFGGTTRWRKVMGRAAANTLFLANAILTAEDAHRAGLIDRLVSMLDDVDFAGRETDGKRIRFLKELGRHASRLSQRELLLVAERLGKLYDSQP